MLAYRYDMFNYKYIGTINCQKDPIASKRKGEDVWLLPAHSTFIDPLPSKDGFDVVWNGSTWEYKEIPQPEPEPEPEPEPLPPTKEEQEQARANAYASEIDPLHARKARKTILGEWTEEDEAEYVAKVKELSASIVARYPYPTDPIFAENNEIISAPNAEITEG